MGIPAPRGTGLVAAPASKKILAMAGLEDCYSTTRGHSRTTGNFITAVFNAVSASYGYFARVMEADCLQQGSVPRTHRLPRNGGRIGQGRRRVLGVMKNR